MRYNFETVDLSDVLVNPQATGQEDLGTLKLSTFSTAWLRDTRDDPIEPSRGFFNTLNFSVASKLYGSEANLVSFFGQHQNHRRVGRSAVLATSLRLGLIGPYGSTPEVPISERFFAGGSTSLRGFDLDLAGPLDPVTNKPLGGNALVILNAELRIPVSGNFAFAPFYDTGNVFARIKDIGLSRFTNTHWFRRALQDTVWTPEGGFGIQSVAALGLSGNADFLHDRQPILMNAEFENRAEANDSSLRSSKGSRKDTCLLTIALVLWWDYCASALPDGLIFRAEVIDRLVAVVNRQIITLGDVEKELKLQELDPLTGDLGRREFIAATEGDSGDRGAAADRADANS